MLRTAAGELLRERVLHTAAGEQRQEPVQVQELQELLRERVRGLQVLRERML